VCCFTNHALDQFLEDLLDVGIPAEKMVRLGGKSTVRTSSLSLYNQQPVSRFNRFDITVLESQRSEIHTLYDLMEKEFASYQSAVISDADLLAHLEFENPDFFAAFSVPSAIDDDGMQRVDKKGKDVDELYLLERWRYGQGPGIFSKQNFPSLQSDLTSAIWRMDMPARRKQLQVWQTFMLREKVQDLYKLGVRHNDAQLTLDRKYEERNLAILKSKRIIGCTTTGAAKHMETVQAALPNVVLVEEAGEILESHVLTALGENASQLCLIGDHL
jgi:hypothetical protein